MLNGDISNRIPHILMVSIKGTLIKPKEPKGLKKLLKMKPEYYIDPVVEEFITRTYLHTNYSVDLYIDSREDSDILKFYEEHIHYNIPHRKLYIKNPEEIRVLLETGLTTCFIDNDSSVRKQVGYRHCYSLAQARHFLR